MKNNHNKNYQKLHEHKDNIQRYSLRRLFEENPKRAQHFSLSLNDFYFDFSKNHINNETLKLLCEFAHECDLTHAIQALVSGKHVNNTEDRAALHTTLRAADSSNEMGMLVEKAQQKMSDIVEKIQQQQWTGFTGKPIERVINIGIGGSDLGPRMVVQALSAYQKNIDVLFVANVDGADLSDTLANTNPETTLFIIASKSFSTLETLENATSARQWMLEQGCTKEQLDKHFIAISTNITAAKSFGIAEANILPMWDWVGGRYSLWSTIGLPIAIAIGMENFETLLEGAREMDEHYSKTPLEKNIPVIAGLLTFWYGQYWECNTHAILPYAQRLSRLPAYLQQLDMESLGKSISRDGQSIDYSTGSVIWGTEGTNGQHSFHQLLHQGTEIIPVDFIAIKQAMSPLHKQHQYLQACCISQSQALLKGKTLADAENELRKQGMNEEAIKALAPHKVIKGNKPSNTIVLEELNPKNLGSLIAFYEHKVYTLGVLLNINPFDQWGVELGKQLGKPVFEALAEGTINENWDGSTKALIEKLST